jgi:hypothetical protein
MRIGIHLEQSQQQHRVNRQQQLRAAAVHDVPAPLPAQHAFVDVEERGEGQHARERRRRSQNRVERTNHVRINQPDDGMRCTPGLPQERPRGSPAYRGPQSVLCVNRANVGADARKGADARNWRPIQASVHHHDLRRP